MKTNPKRGFSLMELIVLLALSGVILFAVSRLVSETYQTLTFLREKAQTYEGAVLGIERLTSDLRGAVAFTGTSPLSFSKVRPSLGMAQGAPPRPYPDPSGYVPPTGPYTDLVNVTYTLNGGTNVLNRQVGAFTSVIAEDVDGFNVTRQGAENFSVVLSIQEQRRIITFQSFVRCPGLIP